MLYLSQILNRPIWDAEGEKIASIRDVISRSDVLLGWTAGAGVDLLLGANWVARAQYRFANFGYPSSGPFKPFRFTDTRTCSGCSAANTPVTVSYELPVMQHNFEVGIAYKFGP